MKKKFFSLALSGVLLCSVAAPALAAGDMLISPGPEAGDTEAPLSDSLLYCGQVKAVLAAPDGTVTGLHMDSEQAGEFIMKITEDTFWIDSGERAPCQPSDVKEGDQLYVFHSPVSTRSMPPQSEAYAIVRNIPQDEGGGMYHKVESVTRLENAIQITTSGGGLFLYADGETLLSSYTGSPAALDAIQAGDHIMAWYGVVALSYPARGNAQHIMALDREAVETEPLTRAELVSLLHTAEGGPVVNYLMDYSDVDQSAPYREAVRWAASEQLVSGYGDGSFGPENAVTWEQMVSILWRWAGSPMLMDYPGLSNYTDAADISLYAQPALAWAHQRGLLPQEGTLGPHDPVAPEEAEAMLAALREAQ